MSKIFKVLFSFLWVMMITFSANAAENNLEDSIMLKKIDNFSIIVDQSGSMYMTSNNNKMNKMILAKEAIKNVVNHIPELTYDSYMTLASEDVELLNQKFDKATLLNSIDKIKNEQEIFGRLTNLQTSIQNEYKIGTEARKRAIILVTDGDWNIGENPVTCVKNLYKNNKNCIVYIISLADTENGEKTISEIVNLNTSSIVIPAESLLNEDTVKEFVEYIFYGYYTPITIQFDFDKSNIKSSELKKIDEVNKIDLLYDEIVINGYTCTIGTESYNQKLSERRAKTVADELNVDTSFGYGESTKYSEIEKNRRAEIILR